MKILCIADNKDPLIYSHYLKERCRDIDLVLSAGDLDLDYYGYIVSVLNKPLFYVFGNHNLRYYPYIAKKNHQMPYDRNALQPVPSFGSKHIDQKVIKHNGLLVAGLGGSLRYNKGENQYTDLQMYFRIFRIIPRLVYNKLKYGRYLDILLTHATPLGIHDQPDRCHTGFRAFVWFLRKFRPRFHIHGHIHIYDINKQRKTKYNNTTVINAYNHIIIDTEKDDV